MDKMLDFNLFIPFPLCNFHWDKGSHPSIFLLISPYMLTLSPMRGNELITSSVVKTARIELHGLVRLLGFSFILNGHGSIVHQILYGML